VCVSVAAIVRVYTRARLAISRGGLRACRCAAVVFAKNDATITRSSKRGGKSKKGKEKDDKRSRKEIIDLISYGMHVIACKKDCDK